MSVSQSSISILYAAAILEFQGDEPGGHFCAPCRIQTLPRNRTPALFPRWTQRLRYH
jgi:hypothetical protein